MREPEGAPKGYPLNENLRFIRDAILEFRTRQMPPVGSHIDHMRATALWFPDDSMGFHAGLALYVRFEMQLDNTR